MTFAQPASKVFDPKAIAKGLFKSRARDHDAWRSNLWALSPDQCYYVQKEFLQNYPAAQFVDWFGFAPMVTQLTHDPLLASLHNPQVWTYAFNNAPDPAQEMQVLHAYWSSVALVRPCEHFKPELMASLHEAIARVVAHLDKEGQPWSTGLTPAVLSYPEETARLHVPRENAVQALTAYTLRYRDLASLQSVRMPYPVLTVLLSIVEMGCFPECYQNSNHALPWPIPENGAEWTHDMLLSHLAVSAHDHLRHWWTLPCEVPALPEHLKEAALMLNIGLQLNYLTTIKDWIEAHVHA